jgi:hypothetical protein
MYQVLEDRGLFIAIAGLIAPRTAVPARKQIGYVVHAATGTTTNAKINTMMMSTVVNNF